MTRHSASSDTTLPDAAERPTSGARRPLSTGRVETVRGPGTRSYIVMMAVVFWLSLSIYLPILPAHVERLGGSLAQVGMVIAAYGLTQFLLRLPMGILSDYLGRRRVFVVAGFVASAASGLGLFLARTPDELTIYRGLAGVSATAWVAFIPLLASAWPSEQVTRAMGMAMFAASMGMVIGTLMGGLMAGQLGWESTFLAGGMLGAAGIGASLLLPDAATRGTPPRRELGRHLTRRALVVPAALTALGQYLAQATAYGFTISHAVRIGATEVELGLLGIAASLPSGLIALTAGGRWSLRLGEHRIVIGGFVVSAAFTALIPWIHDVAWLMAIQAIAAFARGLIMPVLMGAALASVPTAYRAGAMGVYQSVYAFGMFLGPLASGFIGNTWGLPAIFWCGGAEALLAAALAAWLMPRRGLPSVPGSGHR